MTATALPFSGDDLVIDVKRFDQAGVLLLRGALPAEMLDRMADVCDAFAPAPINLTRKITEFDPLLPIFSAFRESWAWRVVERLLGGPAAFLFPASIVRFVHDTQVPALEESFHQDGWAFRAIDDVAMPSGNMITAWIPLREIRPGEVPGILFSPFRPPALFPTKSDKGSEFADPFPVDVTNVWCPYYAVGDVSLHHSLTPHSSARYGRGEGRVSIELRCIPLAAAA